MEVLLVEKFIQFKLVSARHARQEQTGVPFTGAACQARRSIGSLAGAFLSSSLLCAIVESMTEYTGSGIVPSFSLASFLGTGGHNCLPQCLITDYCHSWSTHWGWWSVQTLLCCWCNACPCDKLGLFVGSRNLCFYLPPCSSGSPGTFPKNALLSDQALSASDRLCCPGSVLPASSRSYNVLDCCCNKIICTVALVRCDDCFD